MWTDMQRAALAEAFDRTLGAGPAAVVMAELDKLASGELATRADLRGEIAQLRGEMHHEFGLVRGEMGELRGEMGELRGQMGELRGQMGELRGEMGRLEGRVAEMSGRLDGMLGRQLLADVPLAFAVAALVLAAARLT